ncbi:uncharacterized protein G2W53_027325 [Senna tora]|uniref:Retrotransposon gag domain-containing protein n=1 Tax=Senna tora TaxID=362788 RepID=A0A834WFY7_9FABA|nr:uncharacterized protein G2W53_027325 [Senna tora]
MVEQTPTSITSPKADEGPYLLHNSDHPGMALFTTMLDDLAETFIYCLTAKALEDVLEERFGITNISQLYQVQRQTNSIEQGGDAVMVYYKKICRCWDEIRRLMPLPTCTCAKYTCRLSKKVTYMDASIKLLQFLKGLNPTYDNIRSQILNLDPLATANKAFSMVARVEKQRQVNMIFSHGNEGNAAMLARSTPTKTDGGYARKKDTSKKDKYCEHRHMNGHTKDTCFKIHGYPEWFKDMEKKKGKKQMSNMCNDAAGGGTSNTDPENGTKGDLSNMMSYLIKEVNKLNKNKGVSAKDDQVNFVNLHDFTVKEDGRTILFPIFEDVVSPLDNACVNVT